MSNIWWNQWKYDFDCKWLQAKQIRIDIKIENGTKYMSCFCLSWLNHLNPNNIYVEIEGHWSNQILFHPLWNVSIRVKWMENILMRCEMSPLHFSTNDYKRYLKLLSARTFMPKMVYFSVMLELNIIIHLVRARSHINTHLKRWGCQWERERVGGSKIYADCM